MVWVPLFIFFVQIAYVTLSTVRLIVLMKGHAKLAAAVSFFEVFIYMLGLATVLEHIDVWYNLVIYCLGFALGIYTGSLLEEKMAMGYVTVQVITRKEDSNIPSQLREAGFGVTSWVGEGLTGERLVLTVLTRRRRQKELVNYVKELDPNAFLVSYEPKTFLGGFWVRRTQ
ncbi:MAG: DUF2179 domain-containing protein [Firmicutes bacterium]|uniref:UPF0316 protein SAMN04488112_10772 n=1 Tax=Melghirimyces thermohalophilus TaxID=1236220 RepID=A0A1G6L6E6_9BACL|nr:DUF2179 domain-containing protein [Melghirimyces thermohalophilus]MDA8353731.1 DUF2179 domain-containing protein [Bacillota bacterium]SDC38814.1 Uncharacterized protein YebE, UPF0316 family [Melghirimyces thermohalophilus]